MSKIKQNHTDRTLMSSVTLSMKLALFMTLLMTLLMSLGFGRHGVYAQESEPRVESKTQSEPNSKMKSEECPDYERLEGLPDGTTVELLDLMYWRDRWSSQFDLDAPILTEEAIVAHNAILNQYEEGPIRGQIQLDKPIDIKQLNRFIKGRLGYMLNLFDKGEYIKRGAGQLSPEERALFMLKAPPVEQASLRVALESIQILCGPFKDEIEKVTADRAINRSACTRIRPQAPVQVIGSWSDDLWLIRTRLALGWIPKTARLSPPIPPHHVRRYLDGPFGYTSRETRGLDRAELSIPKGARVPLQLKSDLPLRDSAGVPLTPEAKQRRAKLMRESDAIIATAQGFELWKHQGQLTPAPATLTRGEFLSRIFIHLHKRYGLGGMNGGIDCSRVLIDSLEPFGLSIPRYSGHQSNIGTWSVDLSEVKDLETRERMIDDAFTRGITILYIPGHMMTYLGRDQRGVQRGFHAFSDYQRVCPDGGETTVDAKRVSVTDLKRGEGSKKRSYLERITRIVVLGEDGPGAQSKASDEQVTRRALAPITMPSRAVCAGLTSSAKILLSSAEPRVGQKLRLIVSHPRYDSHASLVLKTPSGVLVKPKLERFGGPPYLHYAEVESLSEAGEWRVVFGEGEYWRGCEHFTVRPSARVIE